MPLTKAQANARLGEVTTAQELRDLINEIDTTGTGTKTLLWSGYAGKLGQNNGEGIHSGDITASLQKSDQGLRTIATTEAARFLEINKASQDYNPQLDAKLKSIFKDNKDEITRFLYGPTTGEPKKRTGKGIWDDVSENFVKQASGDVRLVVGGAGMDRVFAQTEIYALLNNPAIKSIEGVPIEGLRELAASSGVNRVVQLLMGLSEANTGMIKIQVDGAGKPIQAMDGTYRLDASDYLRMNTLGTTLPSGMRPIMDFIPAERRLRHIQAVEEIFKLNPLLYGISYTLPADPDLFKHRSAIARISTFTGRVSDVASMTTMLAEAGTKLNQGDHRGAHDTVTSWAIENAGAFAAGRLATLLAAPLMATGPLGMIIGAGIIIGASIGGAEIAKRLHKKLREIVKDIEKVASPLILDLDGNGIQTLALTGTAIYFDHDCNGFAERSGWVGYNDGLLILDLNNNGKIDNGRELFGNHTLLSNGELAKNGFEALARYDLNRDRVIDNQDAIWSSLRVWRDQNSNAISDPGEWLTLEEANTQSLQLGYVTSMAIDANDNEHKETGFFLLTSGQLATLTDVWFTKDTLDSRQLNPRPVDTATAALPNLAGMGIVPSLHQAMMAPGSQKLRDILAKWIGATRQERKALTQELLFEWCDAGQNPFGVEDREYGSEEPFFKEKVAVIEKLIGEMLVDTEYFVGPLKGEVILSAFSAVQFWVDMILSEQVHVQPLFNLASSIESDEYGPLQMDLTASVDHLRKEFQRDPDPAFLAMIHWNLAHRGPGGMAFFQGLRDVAMTRTDPLAVAMRQQQPVAGPWQWITGTSEHDELYGSSQDDFIEAGADYDLLKGQAGNDTLHGGAGHDFYYGGSGSDTYLISQNGANAYDLIFDESGLADRVIFWDATSKQVQVKQSQGTVSFYSGSRLLTSINKQLVPQHRIEEFYFADGVIWDSNSLLLQLPIQGTVGNDLLIGTSNTSNRLQGLNGRDTLIGGALADHLEGQQDNDLLTGLAGRDTLDGAGGNDTLEGGEGGDRYLFASGGHDIIRDVDPLTSESDRVLFGHQSTTAITRVQRIGQDLRLHFGSSSSLTLVNQLQAFSRIEEFHFANGTTWDHTTLLQRVT
ncbi:MAG: calcium-binding protein [Cyanobacteriota bacterium]